MTVSVPRTNSIGNGSSGTQQKRHGRQGQVRRVSTPPRIAKPLFAAGQALEEYYQIKQQQQQQKQPTFRIVGNAAADGPAYRVLPAPARRSKISALGLETEDPFFVEPVIREVDSEDDVSDENVEEKRGAGAKGTRAAALITSETIAADWKQLVALRASQKSLPAVAEHENSFSPISSSASSSSLTAIDERSPSMSSSPGSTAASASEDSGTEDHDSLGGGGGLQTPPPPEPGMPEKQLLQFQLQHQQQQQPQLVRRAGSKSSASSGDAASLSGSSAKSRSSRRPSGREPGENWLNSPETTAPIAWGARAQSISSASIRSGRTTPSLRRISRNSSGSIINIDAAAANAMITSSDMVAVTERPQTPVVLGGQTLDLATLLPPPRPADEIKVALRRQSWGASSADGSLPGTTSALFAAAAASTADAAAATPVTDSVGRRERKERPRPIGIPFMGDAEQSETGALFGDGQAGKAGYSFETPPASAKTVLSEASTGSSTSKALPPAPSTPRTPTLPDASNEGKFIGSTKSFPSPIQAGFRTPRSAPVNRESIAARQTNGFRNARVLTFGPELDSAGHARTVSLGTASLRPVAEANDAPSSSVGGGWRPAWDPVSPQAPDLDALEPPLSPLAVPVSLEPVSHEPVSFRPMSPPPPVGVIGLGEGLAGGPQRDTRGKKIDLNRWRRADPLVVGRSADASAAAVNTSPAKPTFKKRFSQSLLNLLGDSSGEKSKQQEESADPFAADVPQPATVAKPSTLSKIFSFGRNASKLQLVDPVPQNDVDAPPPVPERSSSHRNSAFLRQRQRQRINDPLSRIPYSPSMPMLVESGSSNEMISSQTRVLSWLSASQQDLSRPSKPQQAAYTQSALDLRSSSQRPMGVAVASSQVVVPTGLPIEVAEEDDEDEEIEGGREDAARRLSGLHRVYGAGVVAAAPEEPSIKATEPVSADVKKNRRQSSLARLGSFFGASKLNLVDADEVATPTSSPSSSTMKSQSQPRRLSFGFRRSRSSKNVTPEASVASAPSPPPKANKRFSHLFAGRKQTTTTQAPFIVTSPIVEEAEYTEPIKQQDGARHGTNTRSHSAQWELRKSIIDQSFDLDGVMGDVDDRLSSEPPRSATVESNSAADSRPTAPSPRTSARSSSPQISDESSIPDSLLEPAMIGQVINAPFHRRELGNIGAHQQRRRSAVTVSVHDLTAPVHLRQGQEVM